MVPWKGKTMKMGILDLRSGGIFGGGIMSGLLAVMVVALAGCEQPLKQGETYHKVSVAWPIFDVEKSEGVSQDGVHWKKETGDAACWLSSWEKIQKFDKEDNQIYRKERKTFIPFYNAEMEKNQQGTKTWGSVLFYPYSSYNKSAASGFSSGAAPKK
jgi:hypothetical protein